MHLNWEWVASKIALLLNLPHLPLTSPVPAANPIYAEETPTPPLRRSHLI